MLTDNIHENIGLYEEKQRIFPFLEKDLQRYFFDDKMVTYIRYPVLHYPAKIQAVSLDTRDTIHAKLSGIKGQYLLFDTGEVLNIRKHGGYVITLSA